MTSRDSKLLKQGVFIDFLRSLAAAHTPRMNCDEMAGDRLTVCEQELLYNNNIYLGKSNQAARKGAGPSKLATQKSNKENAIHAQKNIQNRNMLSIC